MPHRVRFALSLVLGLGVLASAASILARRTARDWFEKDLRLRAELAVTGARKPLVSAWEPGHRRELLDLLVEITRDERILGAAACGTDGKLLVQTAHFPDDLGCGAGAASAEHEVVGVRGGSVHVSRVPLSDDGRPMGSLVLVHDLSFVERREAVVQRFLLVGFGVLSLAASAVTLIAARLAWRGWSRELRATLRGKQERVEFRPILGDVRELVDRLISEKTADADGGVWTAERLKQTLNRHLQGEKIVIVSNREPYLHEREGDGPVVVRHPASGLVTALEPVMRACSGTWIAHGSGTADRECSDRDGRLRVPPGEESYALRRVWLTPEEEAGYYYGFSNEGIWPLCHIAHARPIFRRENWEYYQAVNRRFAEAVTAEADSEDPIVLVQDYHLALAPRMIRERLPRATIITFWHIPWPNSQRFGICPWRKELLEGMLGSSILGFHTRLDCNSFLDGVDAYLEARIDRESDAVVQVGRRTLIRPYPISLEWPSRWAQATPPTLECRASVLHELGLAPDALLGLGIDRLDYTKGVAERLLAVERLLERFPEFVGRFTFVQLAAPSRTAIEEYARLGVGIESLVARINERFAKDGYRPIVLALRHHEPPTVFRYYRAADVCYVSSLHDGMNLVAKEFVAARDDERGVLVLSQFTGASRELSEALIVNPYDVEQASSALAAALQMPAGEQRDRMRAMRAFVAEFNVYRWAGRMLVDAARLRSRDRLAGRLSDLPFLQVGEPH